tara:strand:+ start:518 stop:1135 length:618 start_codon:yes stop_codon:yes gene_type:complete
MDSLGVSKFTFTFEYQQKDLKFILSALYKCYLKIIKSDILIKNNENEIRDIFISDQFLDNHLFKQELDLIEFKFDKEIQTKDGRVDIRVLNMIDEMKGNYKPYYYIECKRIKGDKTYNDYYSNNGINRFINGKYPTYLKENAMIGFVVNNIDIEENSLKISGLIKYNFIDGFNYSYISKHTIHNEEEITLYHLMLNFSNKIATPK